MEIGQSGYLTCRHGPFIDDKHEGLPINNLGFAYKGTLQKIDVFPIGVRRYRFPKWWCMFHWKSETSPFLVDIRYGAYISTYIYI